jgi:peptide/nickel transport system substrate-binding protein
MRVARLFLLLSTALLLLIVVSACRKPSDAFVIALSDKISTIDPVGAQTVDAASERVRVLMFNSLVRKNEKFEYVPDLASNIQRSDDGLSYTFTLNDGIKFHDGRLMTSADAKYTLQTILDSPTSGRTASFYEGSGEGRQSYISGIETQVMATASDQPRSDLDHPERQRGSAGHCSHRHRAV